jgi:signal transduction histidine kinase/DNA-binding response OmpR family regulator
MSGDDKVNILIVDDLPEKVLVLRSVLEELGENVMTAYSGKEALRLALEHEFAVILLDVNMPDIDGFETASLIRQRKKSALTPIIFITAFADELHTARGYLLGAVDYMLTPVVPDILRTKVKVFVDLFRLNQRTRRQAEERIALAQEQALRAAAEETTRQATFLARASTALTSSLDYEETLYGLLRVVVPELADLAAVTVLGERGQPWKTELAWVHPPDKMLHSAALSGDDSPHDEIREAVDEVLRTGQKRVLEDLTVLYPPPSLSPLPPGDRAEETNGRLNRAAILPLRARGRIVGALSLAIGPSGRRLNPAELALAEDLASRAAIAVDNARLYQSVQEGDRHKNEFLAMLAHELRNPLAPIRNAVEVMRLMGPGEAPLVQARDIIDRQVTHMARLIDDLLDMSRISRGKILLRKESVDLVKLVHAVVEDYRTSLEGAGLKVERQLPQGPLWTLGDPTRLAQIVGNVLHNANKFTDAGGRVLIRLTADEDGKTARVSIRDSGIGMEPEILARVFDTFTQADRSLDRSRGGLGLGLALVKGLVDLHGGDVTAHSDGAGKGTEISIRLALQERQQRVNGAPVPVQSQQRCFRILVVEDNVDSAESMRMLLSLAGHQVEVAYSGLVGVETAQEFRPQVVFCDIGLPGGMDGHAVARALRQDLGFASAYLIALTGYGQETDKNRSREAGFDVHLTKPVNYEEIERLLLSVPARAAAEPDACSPPTQLADQSTYT